MNKNHSTEKKQNIIPDICLSLLMLLSSTGCPMLATMETAEIAKKREYPSPYVTGDEKQFDISFTPIYGLPQNQGPIRVGPIVPLLEGKIRWVLVPEHWELALNGGSSGLGLGTKVKLIGGCYRFATRFGISGFPTIIQNSPVGCYSLDFIGSMDHGKNTTLYGGCKFISWFDIPALSVLTEVRPLYPVDPYFDALGGFLGIKLQNFTIELGCYYIFDELENYWGFDKGYIPVIGISVPMNNSD